jgi:hypothetical protein
MRTSKRIIVWSILFVLTGLRSGIAVETLESLIAGAKKEPEFTFIGVPKNSAHPSVSKLFVGFMASKEAQGILEKNDFRTSHLVDGTIMARYLKQNRVQLQEAKDSSAFYLLGEDSGLELKEELTKMLKQ